MDHPIVTAAGAHARGALAGQPDVPHAHATRADHVARQRVADERRRLWRDAERLEGVTEDARVGLQAPDPGRVSDGVEERADSRVGADALEVAVEVGDDAEPVPPRETLEQGSVVCEALQRSVEEPSCDGP